MRTTMHQTLLAAAIALAWTSTASGDVITSPLHDHTSPGAVTWDDGHAPIATHQHQHRTPHNPTAGQHVHSTGAGAAAYVATKVWVDRTLLTLGAGPGHAANEFAHGHQDTPGRYLTQAAVAGGDISAAEAVAWNDFAAIRVFDAFNGIGMEPGWLDVGNASGPSNWHNTDNTDLPPAPGGRPWHSTVNWIATAGAEFELEILYGEAGVGNLGVTNFILGHSHRATIIMDDDVDWFYGVNTDPTVASTQFDFATTMLHEVGHVLGFGHFGSIAAGQIMTIEDQPDRGGAGGIDHSIDLDAIHGLRDLYAIAVPEPASLILFAVGSAALWVVRRRRRATHPLLSDAEMSC